LLSFEGIHRNKAEQLPNGQLFPYEKSPLKNEIIHIKSLCMHIWNSFRKVTFNLTECNTEDPTTFEIKL